MKTLQAYREKASTRNVILGTGLAYFAFQLIILLILYPLGLKKVFTIQTTLSSTVVHDILADWVVSGQINRYLCHYYLDFPLPFIYGILLVALYSKFLELFNFSSKHNIVILLPMIIGALDIFENISHLSFIYIDGAITPILVGLSGTAARLKWALLSYSLLLFVIFCTRLFVRKVWKSK